MRISTRRPADRQATFAAAEDQRARSSSMPTARAGAELRRRDGEDAGPGADVQHRPVQPAVDAAGRPRHSRVD